MHVPVRASYPTHRNTVLSPGMAMTDNVAENHGHASVPALLDASTASTGSALPVAVSGMEGSYAGMEEVEALKQNQLSSMLLQRVSSSCSRADGRRHVSDTKVWLSTLRLQIQRLQGCL